MLIFTINFLINYYQNIINKFLILNFIKTYKFKSFFISLYLIIFPFLNKILFILFYI